ncbi:MAG TPA: DUF1501 domain-containing protein [Chthoniobacteraceae bacterium]|jgi:hypothetical protein|nr:DUF1501 domain-containing protein [Chthoniobacteraceae bacterium]
MNLRLDHTRALTRREFLTRTGRFSLGSIALGSMFGQGAFATSAEALVNPLTAKAPPSLAKARAVIYLSMSGAPPQHDLFDYKPKLNELHMQECPDEYLKGQTFAFIKGKPKILGSPYKFAQHGGNGAWTSELLPHFSKIVDEVSIVRSMNTDQFNHAPAELFLYTGNMRAGSASMGAWATYGLGSENQDLPGYVVMLSGGTDPTGGKSLWGSGFLPSVYQGVQCRSVGAPILYSDNPAGMTRETRRRSLDALKTLNEAEAATFGDPETVTRVAQYELAYRMQLAVPEVMDISKENPETLAMYGAKPGEASFANNCLLARRLVEKGVRFVQLFDWGWDVHGTFGGDDLMAALPRKCREVDQASAALVQDLKQRGLLDSTLVIWGGEFGRTPMNEARGGSTFLGRDHHPHAFTIWMAGGGVKRGLVLGETDELGYHVGRDKVTVRDFQATVLHLLGFDPYRFSYKYQGLNQRLIGPTNEGQIVKGLLA